MKLSPIQLGAHLAQTLGKLYLVCGDDPFLVQESLNTLRQKAMAAGFEDRMRLDIETDSDLENSYTYAYSPPLLGLRRLLEFHWKSKLTKAGQQFLQNYAGQPSPHSLVIVRLNKLDSKTEQTQWFKTLEKNSVVISIWPLAQKQFPAWIMQRAQAHHFQLTPGAAQMLAHHTEGNLQAAAQEIEKLSLLGSNTIDQKTVESFVIDQGCFTAFDLVDQALAGNAQQVLRILHYLKSEGSEPLLILGAFTFELRTIAKIVKDLKKGSSLSTLFSQYRVRPSKQATIRDYLKRCTDHGLFALFLKAGEIDRLVKGALQGDIWLGLEAFSLSVTGIGSWNHI